MFEFSSTRGKARQQAKQAKKGDLASPSEELNGWTNEGGRDDCCHAKRCSLTQFVSAHFTPPLSFYLFIYFLHKMFHYTVFSACLLHKLLLIFIFSFHLLIKYTISPLHVGLLTSIQPISKAAGVLETASQRSVEAVNPFAYHCLGCSRHPFLPPRQLFPDPQALCLATAFSPSNPIIQLASLGNRTPISTDLTPGKLHRVYITSV